MRTAYGMSVYRMEALLSLLITLLAATQCQAAGVNETGVNSTDLQVVASQPMMVSCDAPSPLGTYDTYCEGLRADYFLLPKQRQAPSLTGLTPNISTFVTSLNDTAAALSFKGVNALIAAKTYSFAVRYTGVLFFDIAGRYDFSLNSPAGTRLTINGNTVTFNQATNASTPTTGYTFSKAGYLPIELVFFNENSVPSLKVQWTGPADAGVKTVIEGSSIQFNCSHLQNNTNSVPAKTSTFCPGLSAVYYSDWSNSSYATATGVATYAIYEQGLNHWSTSTTPFWSRLPATLKSSFSGRFHGQLWIPLPGTYTFKLQATRAASLFLDNTRILNSTAVNGVAQAKTVTYSFATAGYTPVGLNFLSRRVAPEQAGVLRLAWKGPNSPAFKVVYGFTHPCSSFVACSNTTTAGALPAEVVGTPPAGTTIESASAIRTASLATYIPNSNVTFTLAFPGLNAEDPSVDDVSYFVREAIANAAGVRLESVWTVPSLDDEGEVVFPIGAYFTSVASAMRFYNLVNLRPDTIFSNSAGLYAFYPITVSSPDMGTRVASSSATVPAPRTVARLASATGEGNDIPLPPTPLPTPTSTPNASAIANTTTDGRISSPSPTATPTDTPTATAATPIPTLPSLPEAQPSTPVATLAAPAPAPVAEGTPVPLVTPTPLAPAPAPEETETPVPTSTGVATPAAPAPAPEATATPVPIVTPVAPAPEATATPVPIVTPVAPVPAPEATETPVPTSTGVATPVAPAPAPEATATPVPIVTPVAPAPAPEATETPVPTSTGVATPVAPAPEATEAPEPVVTPVAPAPALDATGTPVPTSTGVATPVAPAPAPEEIATPVPIVTPVAPAPAPETTPMPVVTPAAPSPAPVPANFPPPFPTVTVPDAPTDTPVAPAPAPEGTSPVATPTPPSPAPLPADIPFPVPTAEPTPMAPSPAPVAPETPVPTPTRAPALGGPQVPVATPYASVPTPTPTSPIVYGRPPTPSPSVPTPTAYAIPGSAPSPAPSGTPISVGTPSPTMYSSPGMADFPSGGPAPAGGPPPAEGPDGPAPFPSPTPYAAPPTGGPESRSSPRAPVLGDAGRGAPRVDLPPSAPTPYATPPTQGPVSGPSPAPTPYATPPTQGPVSGPFPAPTPYATPPTQGPASGPSPAPTPYAIPPTQGPVSGPYPTISPVVFAPPAYASPPPPYSPLIASPPTSPASSPALTIPSDAILVYAPPPTTITFTSPSPTPRAIPYYSPSPVNQGAPRASLSPSPKLFGSPSPTFGSSPSTPGGPLLAPLSDLCAYGGSSYYVPYSQGVGGYKLPCSHRAPLAYPVSPTPARLPVYYGLPVTCPPGAASCRSGPYSYYAVRGTDPLTPADEAALLGQSPSVSSPSPQMYYSPMFGRRVPPPPRASFPPAPAPGPSVGPAIAPAPGPTAQCACDSTDVTPRSVKLEVLSTAYNSTTSDTIKFNAYLTFSHPTRSLNSSQVRVFTRQPSDGLSGTVTTPGVVNLLQPISQNCAFYSLKGYVSESNPFAVNSTSIFLAAGGDILDACGSPFNVTVTRVEQANRLSGLLYATGVAYSEEAGALLDGNVLDLALAFTEPVPRLSANMFTVTGPPKMASTDLEPVDGSDSYFTFSVTLPENYYGSVRVAMNRAGRKYLTSINPAAVAPSSLTINRADPVTQGSLVNSTMTKTHSL